MKKRITATVLLIGATILVGHPAPGGDLRQEFGKQLGESVPVKEWGYKVKDLRFSESNLDALVVFAVAGKTNTVTEIILHRDDFARYTGQMAAFGEETGADRRRCGICVAFPAYKGLDQTQEGEFRRQIGESAPVRDWGYKIKEVRFSEDNKKALVVFLPASKTNSVEDLILERDQFRRYQGRMLNVGRMAAPTALGNRGRPMTDWNAWITVTFAEP